MLLGGHVAEHRRAVVGRHGAANGAGDVVIAGGNVGDHRPEDVEGRLEAELLLLAQVLRDQVERHVPRPLDHYLNVVLPGARGQLAQGAQFGELGLVVGVGQAAWAQAVAQAKADVVSLEDLTDRVEVGVERVLLLVRGHPAGEDRPTTADDAGEPAAGQGNVLPQQAGVNRHVVNALPRLRLDHLQQERRRQLFRAFHPGHRLVERHRAQRHRAVGEDGLADGPHIAAGAQVHHRVGPVAEGYRQLLLLRRDIGGGGGVAEVGVHLAAKVGADQHRPKVGVPDVGRQDRPPARDLGAHKLGADPLLRCRVAHLLGDRAGAGIVPLRYVGASAPLHPLLTHDIPSQSGTAALPALREAAAQRGGEPALLWSLFPTPVLPGSGSRGYHGTPPRFSGPSPPPSEC